jgi:hypothetical protein
MQVTYWIVGKPEQTTLLVVTILLVPTSGWPVTLPESAASTHEDFG